MSSLIEIVDGPSGSRARLVGGGDVWEVVATVRDNDGSINRAADYLSLDPRLIEAAMAYYQNNRAEIDARIAANEQLSREAEANWLAGN